MSAAPALRPAWIEVRPADESDFIEMAAHGEVWWLQTEFSKSVPYSAASVIATLRVLAEQKLLLVAYMGLELVGFVGGAVAPMYMNMDYKLGTEMFWWVHPDQRHLGIGRLLLDGIEKAAKTVGCRFWTMLAMECMDPERVGAIYEDSGYYWAERSYIKEL